MAEKLSADLSAALGSAVREFADHLARTGGSACDRYVLMAVSDRLVQQKIIDKAANHEQFERAYCLEGPAIPELKYVVFEFRCVLPKICLLPQRFLVVLDFLTGEVKKIVDPYADHFGPSAGTVGTGTTGTPTTGTFFPTTTTGTTGTPTTTTGTTGTPTTGTFFPTTTTGTTGTPTTTTGTTGTPTTGTFFPTTTTGTTGTSTTTTGTPTTTTGTTGTPTTGTFFPTTTATTGKS